MSYKQNLLALLLTCWMLASTLSQAAASLGMAATCLRTSVSARRKAGMTWSQCPRAARVRSSHGARSSLAWRRNSSTLLCAPSTSACLSTMLLKMCLAPWRVCGAQRVCSSQHMKAATVLLTV